MIVDERLVTYINSLDTGNTTEFWMLSNEKLWIPMFHYSEGDAELFEALLAMTKPKKNSRKSVLRYFSILMAEYDLGTV